MIVKMIFIPIFIVITALRVCLGIIVRMSDWIFYLLGMLFLITTACCYYMQLETATGLKQMIIGSGIMFLIPQAATILIAVLEVVGEVIGNRIGLSK